MSGYIDEKGFVHCPVCGNKTRTKVLKVTVLKQFPLFCPKCGQECIINVENKNLTLVEPDAQTQSR